jgi:hypothetical protein
MTIDGKVEYVRKLMSELSGEEYYLVHTQGRKFVTYDMELGETLENSIGQFGRFTYAFFKGAGPNVYLLQEWWKDGWK